MLRLSKVSSSVHALYVLMCKIFSFWITNSTKNHTCLY
jgi:hypothetical protein